MRVVWAIFAIIVAVGLLVWLQPPQGSRVDPYAQLSDDASIDAAVNETIASSSPTTKSLAPVKPLDPVPDLAKSLANDLLTPRANATGSDLGAGNVPLVSKGAKSDPAEAATPTEFVDGLDRAIKSATVTAGRFARSGDGTLVADGRYAVRGSGTIADPYVLSWELLTSVMDTYAPRQDLNEIPQRVAMLDGKHVRIDGYFAFPLVSTEAKQLIVTPNQWDGCCIGVPPTAYDAIEVTLNASVSVQRRLHQIMFGTVEGIFRVEPYVMDQWLVGLYLLDDATLKIDL